MGILSNVIETFYPAKPGGIGHFTFMPDEELDRRLKEFTSEAPNAPTYQAHLDAIERYKDELYIVAAMLKYSINQTERWRHSPPTYPECGFRLNALPVNLSGLDLTYTSERIAGQITAIDLALAAHEPEAAQRGRTVEFSLMEF